MAKVKYNGPTPPKKTWFQVKDETKNQFQAWHHQPFSVAANAGIELIYPYQNVTIDKSCPEPFKLLSDKFYQLDLDTVLSVPKDSKLMILPHYTFYNENSIPLPISSVWECSWWPLPISVIFRFLPYPVYFKKGEPFAQAIIIENTDCQVVPMTPEEKDDNNKSCEYIESNKDKYITRKWTMDSGIEQNNLYNVFGNNLPKNIFKKKRYKLIRRSE